MWGPCGSHADSATTSDKTRVKTTEDLKRMVLLVEERPVSDFVIEGRFCISMTS
jgi:hypothetical protein